MRPPDSKEAIAKGEARRGHERPGEARREETKTAPFFDIIKHIDPRSEIQPLR